jgi:hypothetical protein
MTYSVVFQWDFPEIWSDAKLEDARDFVVALAERLAELVKADTPVGVVMHHYRSQEG